MPNLHYWNSLLVLFLFLTISPNTNMENTVNQELLDAAKNVVQKVKTIQKYCKENNKNVTVPAEVWDKIVVPHENGFQSLYVFPDSTPLISSLEIQIQTPRMRERAETGAAANYRLNQTAP